MSFEIAIWKTEAPIGDTAAAALYTQIVRGDLSRLKPHPAIDAFYKELVSRHPEINDVPPDKVDDTDLCPWSSQIDRSPAHLLLSCVWSKIEMVGDLVGELQVKHGVTAYVPGQAKEHYEPGRDAT